MRRLCKLNCSVVLMKTCASFKEAAQKGELPLDAIEALGDILTKCEINGMDKWDKGQDRNIFEFYATMHAGQTTTVLEDLEFCTGGQHQYLHIVTRLSANSRWLLFA